MASDANTFVWVGQCRHTTEGEPCDVCRQTRRAEKAEAALAEVTRERDEARRELCGRVAYAERESYRDPGATEESEAADCGWSYLYPEKGAGNGK